MEERARQVAAGMPDEKKTKEILRSQYPSMFTTESTVLRDFCFLEMVAGHGGTPITPP
jgi:hypothetical protein